MIIHEDRVLPLNRFNWGGTPSLFRGCLVMKVGVKNFVSWWQPYLTASLPNVFAMILSTADVVQSRRLVDDAIRYIKSACFHVLIAL